MDWVPMNDLSRAVDWQRAELMAQIETAVIEDQVVDWLLDHAEVTEKPMQFKDLMEPAH